MNHTGLERFMENHGNDILSFCKYLTRNKEEAEDLCQDTFVLGFETADHIGDENHAKRFFLSTAIQLWKNRKRKYAWRRRIINDRIIPMAEHDMDMAAEEDIPEQEFLRQEKNTIIRECVNSLPDKKRLVVLLYYTEGLSEKEISDILGIPKGTVKSRLYQAKAELSKKLSKELTIT